MWQPCYGPQEAVHAAFVLGNYSQAQAEATATHRNGNRTRAVSAALTAAWPRHGPNARLYPLPTARDRIPSNQMQFLPRVGVPFLRAFRLAAVRILHGFVVIPVEHGIYR